MHDSTAIIFVFHLRFIYLLLSPAYFRSAVTSFLLSLAKSVSLGLIFCQVVVTIWYRAPELLLGAKHYTSAVGILSKLIMPALFLEQAWREI